METCQTLEAISYKESKLFVLDQLQLPKNVKYEAITCVEEGWQAIKQMKVRGAPCIAIVGCLSLAVELNKHHPSSKNELTSFIVRQLDYLTTARPTAVNMKGAAESFKTLITQLQDNEDITADQIMQR